MTPVIVSALDLSPLVQPLLAALGLVILAIGALLAQWIRSKLKTDQQREIFDRVAGFMGTEVRAIAQALRPEIATTLADGKVTKEEARQLRDAAISRVKENLGRDGLQQLESAIGDRKVDDYLISLLESKLHAAKTGNDGFARTRVLLFASILGAFAFALIPAVLLAFGVR